MDLHTYRLGDARTPALLWLACALAALAGLTPRLACADTEPFQFQEVFDLLKANLAGTSEPELNRAAVRGLLDQLSGKVTVVGDQAPVPPPAAKSPPVTASLFDGRFGYIRLSRLGAETDQEFRAALDSLRPTNALKGLVLDLRFANGQDYGAAVALADRFLPADQPLVDWGEGWKKSKGRSDAITPPLTILVNRKTSGAAEVLAGILRFREVGLLIGTNTAGQASMAKEFTLKTGQRLRVAIAPVKVADGQELPFTGIQPDIEVEVSAEDELAWYEDAYRLPKGRPGNVATNDTASAGTNRPARNRINEAYLVRMSREGQSPERDPSAAPPPASRPADSPPVVHDPVLGRALDLLRGLAVVQSSRVL
jgi:hypothetical protein